MDLAARIQTGSSQVRRDDVIDFQGVGVVSRAADPIVRMESSEQCKPLSKTDKPALSVVKYGPCDSLLTVAPSGQGAPCRTPISVRPLVVCPGVR
jgi:hypothetical protein